MDKKIIQNPKTNNTYILTKILGKGSFGQVYFSDPYAVKIVSLANQIEEDIVKILRNQAELLSKIKNKNVVGLIEYFEIEKKLYLVMQYCQTDLQKYLQANKELSEQKILSIFKQILSGYKEIYTKQIIHRDIKPANILVKNNNQFKLADFGLARYVKQNQLLQTKAGTPLFSSPQLLKKYQKYTTKNDIWSLGVLLYIMIFDKYPWNAKTQDDLINKILSQPLCFPSNKRVSDSTKQLLTKMFIVDEDKRISWIQLFQQFNIYLPFQKQYKKNQKNRCKSAQKNNQKRKQEKSKEKSNENLKNNISSQSYESSQKFKKNMNQRSVSLHPNPRLKRLQEEDNKSQKNKNQASVIEEELKIKIVSLFKQGAKKVRNFLSSTSHKDNWTSEEIKQLIQAEGSIYCGESVASKIFTKNYKQMSPGQRDDFRKILHNFNENFQNVAKMVYEFEDK